MKTIERHIIEKLEEIIRMYQFPTKIESYQGIVENTEKYIELSNELDILKSQLKDAEQVRSAEDFPEIDFRKDIAEKLSKDELINRFCGMNENYQKMRKEWIEKCSPPNPILKTDDLEVKTIEQGTPFDEPGCFNPTKFEEVRTAKEILSKHYSKILPNHSKYRTSKDIIVAMEEFASQFQQPKDQYGYPLTYANNKTEDQFQEQPITVTDEMIKAEAKKYSRKILVDDSHEGRKSRSYAEIDFIAGFKLALSLKAQKAQPSDEDIEKWTDDYVCEKVELIEGDTYNAYFQGKRNGVIEGAKAMRDGLIPVSK